MVMVMVMELELGFTFLPNRRFLNALKPNDGSFRCRMIGT